MTPDGWKHIKLGEFVSLQRGYDLPEQSRNPGDIPIMGSSGLTGWHNAAKVTAPGIVIGRSGASFGVAHYCSEDFWPLNTALFVTDFHGNDVLFAYYLLDAINFSSYNSGGAQPSLNRNFIYPMKITVPPLDEQRRIAEILGTWDEAITLTERLIEARQRRKKGLMQQLLTGKTRFGEFVGEWKRIRLGDLVSIQSGTSPSEYHMVESGQYPFIKVEDMNNCSKYQIDSRFYTNDQNRFVDTESVIFPKRGAAISNNKVRLVARPLYMDSNMMALTVTNDNRLNPEYLYYTLLQEKLYKIADTSTIPQINNKHIIPYKIKLPPIEEQRRIAAVLQACDAEIELLGQKLSALKRQKSGLMQQLLSGRVRV